MKNQILKTITSSLILIFFLTSIQAQKFGRVVGNGKIINKTRNVGSFEKVAVSGSFDVTLVKGKEGKVDIKIEENLLDYLVTKVEDGKLRIKWQKGVNINTRRGVMLTVYFNEVNAVTLSGSGDVTGEDVMKADEFKTAVSGSGDVTLKINANHVRASVSGSGDVTLNGKTNSFEAAVSGSGDIDAYDLISETAILKIAGSGDINLTVNKELEARVSGSGDISYKGNPKIQKIKVSGSGDVSSY